MKGLMACTPTDLSKTSHILRQLRTFCKFLFFSSNIINIRGIHLLAIQETFWVEDLGSWTERKMQESGRASWNY